MMNNNTRAAMQALEALTAASKIMDPDAQKRQDDAITGLEAALAEQQAEQAEPVTLKDAVRRLRNLSEGVLIGHAPDTGLLAQRMWAIADSIAAHEPLSKQTWKARELVVIFKDALLKQQQARAKYLQDLPEELEALKQRLKNDPEFSKSMLLKAGIINKNGELTEGFGGCPTLE